MIKRLARWILRYEIENNSTRLYSTGVLAGRVARAEARKNDELYFNGILCINGCGTLRLTSSGRCTRCVSNQRKQAYYNKQDQYIAKEAARKAVKRKKSEKEFRKKAKKS